VKKRLKEAVRAVLRVPERSLHTIRRRQARERLGGVAPKSIVFVCYGNICRSPYAARVFERLWAGSSREPLQVSSVGFIHPGRGSPPQALAAAQRRGIDLSSHKSRLLTKKALAADALVVVMSSEQARAVRRMSSGTIQPLVLGDFDPLPILTRTIIDPWGGADSTFDESYERIDRCVRELVVAMTSVPVDEGVEVRA